MMGVDPDGNLFFLFPSISFDGGFSIGLTAGFGIPGIADISGTVGYNFQHGQGYASIGANAGPFSVSYGTGGFNASIGVGFNQSGFGFSLGGLNYNGREGFSLAGPSVTYGHRFEFQNKPQGVPYTPTFPDINPTPINLELPSFTNKVRQKLASINLSETVNTNLTYNGGNLPTVVVTAYKNRTFAKIMGGLEGLPYKWQANGSDKFDCSGAVCHGIRQVIGSFGDYTADQLYDFTSPVEDLKRGYLKFYDYTDDGTMDHVTTVLNSKQMLHPSSLKGVIERTTLTYLNSYTKTRGGKIYTQQINWKLLLKR